MGLPDRGLLDIMAISFRKERRPCLLCYCVNRSTRGVPISMVIVTEYELVEHPNEGVFCEERGADSLSLL